MSNRIEWKIDIDRILRIECRVKSQCQSEIIFFIIINTFLRNRKSKKHQV